MVLKAKAKDIVEFHKAPLQGRIFVHVESNDVCLQCYKEPLTCHVLTGLIGGMEPGMQVQVMDCPEFAPAEVMEEVEEEKNV